jgi:signal transduction histidine kinase
VVLDALWFQQEQLQQTDSLLEFLATINYRSGELAPYLHNIACGVSRLLGSDWSIVTLCQNGTGQIIASSRPLSEQACQFSAHDSLAGEVTQSERSLLIEDTQLYTGNIKPPDGYFSYLGVPMRTAQGDCIGTICSLFHRPHRLTTEMIRLVEIFAERAATAIDNYQLYQQQNQLNQALKAEIQERQQAEQELARMAEIGKLSAMIVHEIRNPLTTVLLGLAAFRDADLSERLQQRLILALEEAERLKRLLNEILLYTRPQILQACRLDLNSLAVEVLDLMQTSCNHSECQITFISSLPEAHIRGDRDKLKQVFINLVKNAYEAVQPGDVITWRIDPGSSENEVCVQIHNSGKPIPAKILSKLGTPFFTTKSSGNGLGLAIVKRIIELHLGGFCIESKWSYGTTVSIRLPLD